MLRYVGSSSNALFVSIQSMNGRVALFACAAALMHCGPGETVTGDAARTDANVMHSDGTANDVPSMPDGAVVDVVDPPDASLAGAYLPNRRTYDQENDYIVWDGPVSFVTLMHRDNTSLPASEGGGSCTGGCTEQVTRIGAGGCIRGNFYDLCGFRFQLASEPGAGTAVVTACDQPVGTFNLVGSGTPGFVNLPASGNWVPPTQGACTWSICAMGSFADIRAVTPTYCPAPAPPTVDLKVNGVDGPITLSDPASYTLTWTTTNVVSCVTSGSWMGGVANDGGTAFHSQPAATYNYTISCMNSLGTASDAVTVIVQRPPG